MSKHLLFVSILLLSSAVASPLFAQGILVSGVPPENPEISEGVRSALRGDHRQAEVSFADALKKKPGSRPGGIDAAMAFAGESFDQYSFGKLRFWLEKTAEDVPDDPEAFLLLADIAFSDGRYLESSMLSEHARKLAERFNADPERQRSLKLYAERLGANIAEERERWDEAAKRFKALLALEPNDGEFLYRLGLAQYRLGEKEESLKSLDKAAEKDTRILPAQVVLAQLAEQEGRTEEAASLLSEALKTLGENPRVLVAAADLELKWNGMERVRSLAEKAKKLDPSSSDAEILLGIVDLYENKYAEAEAKFMNVVDILPSSCPQSARALTGLALALCEQDDARQLRRAFTIAKLNVDKNPRSLDAQTTLAWVLVKSNSLDEAEKILERQFEAGEMNSPGAYYLAVIYSKRNRSDEAILFLQHALATKTNFPKRAAAEMLLKTMAEEEVGKEPRP